MPLNKGFLLASRPQGVATEGNFRFFERDIGEPGPGEVLVRNHWLSLDPYMRGRMDEAKSYAASQALDAPMIGGTAGEVVASSSPDFKAGDKVVSVNGGWQLYAIQKPAMLRKVDDFKVPLQAFVGPLGMPGVTAWVGINRIIQPKAGETVVCSAATGAVGTVVGQIVKAKGARAVGIAGGPEKCRFAVEQLGYDLCVDHKAADFAQQLDGGDARRRRRPVRECRRPAVRADHGAHERFRPHRDLRPDRFLRRRTEDVARATCASCSTRRLTMRGFIVTDFLPDWPAALGELIGLASTGKLKWRETIAQGIESAPSAFLGMLKGKNFGKQLVKLT